MSDDHSANAISCYNSILSSVFKTPNLDRIATEGTRLDRYFATNAICTPARATVMTGQYGHVNGVRTLTDCWEPLSGPNLAALLHDAGYQTALIGKWHLHTEPVGFDHYQYLTDMGGQGVYWNPAFLENGKGRVEYQGYVTDIITDMTVNWLRSRPKEHPFFLMCHHKAPHDFWQYPPRYEHLFDGISIPEPDTLFEDRSHRSIATRNYGSSVTPRSKIRSLYEDFCKPDYVTGPLIGTEHMSFQEKGRAAYGKYLRDYLRTVAGIDDSVGHIIKELEEGGILDDTIVIYTSDQGMFLGEHDYQDKRWSFEESLRAPFLIRYPAEIPAGSECRNLMANIDLAPTLLDYAGVGIPEEMQGESCRAMLAGNDTGFIRHEVYFRYWMHRAHRHDNPAHYGIRTDRYKLTFYYGLPLDASGALDSPTPAGWELYDLEKDPFETKNVYESPEYQEVVQKMKVQLEQAKIKYKDTDQQYPEIADRLASCP